MRSIVSSRYFKVLLSVILVVVVVASSYLIADPQRVDAWSAVSSVSAAHQVILQQAYKLLQADPAYDPTIFPPLDEIMACDGVAIVGLGGIGSGPGPDVDPNSPYSDHYYNPRAGIPDEDRGGAPQAVKREYGYLLEGMYGKNKEGAAHAASWTAHFLSDIETPYHNNGTPFLNLSALYHQKVTSANSKLILSDNIVGPLIQGYSTLGGKESNPDFRAEAESFMNAADLADEKDWFDPWYWNGVSIYTSSHVLWEGNVRPQDVRYSLSGYNQDWNNAATRFARLYYDQPDQAFTFALATAKDSLDNLLANEEDMGQMAIQKSIQRVYTLWRSSLTALRPSYQASIIDKKKAKIRITGKVNNIAREAVTNVQVSLAVSGGAQIDGKEQISSIHNIANIAANGSAETSWEVTFDRPGDNPVKLEVIGSYLNTPDLQYAVTEGYIVAPTPSPEVSSATSSTMTANQMKSVAMLFDCSKHEPGLDVYQLYNILSRCLDSVPQNGAEVILWAYGGNTPDEINVMHSEGFNTPGFYKNRLSNFDLAAWANARTEGKAPLAQALDEIGDYLDANAKGTAASVIYVGSGIDDCGGDPVQAAKDLNLNSLGPSSFRLPFEEVAEAAGRIPIRLEVVGLNVPSQSAEKQLRAMASAGGGSYYTANDMGQLQTAMSQALQVATRVEKTGSGFRFQSWWFIAASGLILFLILLTALTRRRPRTAWQTAGGSSPPSASQNVSGSPSPGAAAVSKYCPRCGTWAESDTEAYCSRCGGSLAIAQAPPAGKSPSEQTVYCTRCGTPIASGDVFCGRCGSRVGLYPGSPGTVNAGAVYQTPTTVRNTNQSHVSWAWWLMPIFLGWLGGLVGWLVVREKNKGTARGLLWTGIIVSILWFLLAVGMGALSLLLTQY